LLLATIGVYALIASSERKRELGIRLALGASLARAILTIALPGVGLAGGGVLAGSLMAAYGVTPCKAP
jgi:hypothetical protein